jgi:hypothetical protein
MSNRYNMFLPLHFIFKNTKNTFKKHKKKEESPKINFKLGWKKFYGFY